MRGPAASTAWPRFQAEARARETLEYFENKAERYDETDAQPYWAFSDRVLWQLLQDLALDGISNRDEFRFLDAGAGTARWSLRLLQHFPESRGVLVDLSPDMLRVAERKLVAGGFRDRAQVRRADLGQIDAAELGRHDLVICFHNVLSFVSDPALVIGKLLAATESGGTLVLVIPNLFHAAYFSVAQQRWEELDRIERSKTVRFNDHVPEMCLFTPDETVSMLRRAGARVATAYGFPVTLYPGMQETHIEGSSAGAIRTLSDDGRVQRLLALERSLCRRPEAASRGNNLLVVARR